MTLHGMTLHYYITWHDIAWQAKALGIEGALAVSKLRKKKYETTSYANVMTLIRDSMRLVYAQYPTDTPLCVYEEEQEAFVTCVLETLTDTTFPGETVTTVRPTCLVSHGEMDTSTVQACA